MWSSDENEDDVYAGSSAPRETLQRKSSAASADGSAPASFEKIDIYDGLDTSSEKFLLIEMREKLQASGAENQRLRRENLQLTKRNEELEKLCTNLERNISCLYTTAKSELSRKDSIIVELQGKQTRVRR